MVQEDNQSKFNRRHLLQGIGGAGIAAVAGCLGSESEQSDTPFEIQFEVNANNDDRVQMVELIANSLEQTGYFSTSVEDYEWNTYVSRVMGPDYPNQGVIPAIGLSGEFNPGSYCSALHHSSNQGQCCNLNGISDSELDEMIDNARFDAAVADDPELRAERYDEIWRYLADHRYSSITHFDLEIAVLNTDVYGFTAYPFQGSLLSYGLYAPHDEQITWVDRESDTQPADAGLSDLSEGGTLAGAIAANVESFDPPYSTDANSLLNQNLVFEQLIRLDDSGNVYPWLAESYELVETQDIDRTAYEEYMTAVAADDEGAIDTDEQIIVQHPDDDPVADDEVRVITPAEAADAVADGVFGMQYQYNLHEGITFHNGEELTAEHVVQSCERYENSQMSAQTFDSLLHAEAVDDYTVNLYAQVPDAEAERQLPGIHIHSLEQADMEGGELDPRQGTTPVGTGPYELTDFEDEQYVEYAKFDDYWLENLGLDSKNWFDGPSSFPDGPVIDAIELQIVPDDATRAGALQNGEIDLAHELASGTLDDFEDSEDYVVAATEAGAYDYIQYPVNVEPWDDKRLRKAVNYLIPRQQIVDNVLNGWGSPAWTDLPALAEETGTTDAEALEEDVRPYNEYNPERATELIEEVIDEYDL
ncbi:ABC transporter substrate-binding protein [Halopiger thermotolerans]